MNYIGSKLSLLDFICNSICDTITTDLGHINPQDMIFSDIFAGTGIVGQEFKRRGFGIISNDLQYYSYIINKHYIENNEELEFQGLIHIIKGIAQESVQNKKNIVISYLNELENIPGFIYNNYCIGGTVNTEFERMYFSDSNGMKCDSIRNKIEEWHINAYITDGEYFYLLACLLNSIDKSANTASVYGAFLKKFKKSAKKDFSLDILPIIPSDRNNIVYNQDANVLINNIRGDILYLDPPYNERQYATNYHLLETIARYDNPEIRGKTGLRNYEDQKSLYCSSRTVSEAFEDLIANANFRYIFLSYNNEGLMSLDDVRDIMSAYGQYRLIETDYKRFKADMDKNRKYSANKTTEYLHILIKDLN